MNQAFNFRDMQMGVGEYQPVGSKEYQSYSPVCGQMQAVIMGEIVAKTTEMMMQDAPKGVFNMDVRQLVSWRTMVGRADGDRGFQDVGDAARLVGQTGKLVGDVVGGGLETTFRTMGEGAGALGMKSAQGGLNAVGGAANKVLSGAGGMLGSAGQGLGAVGGGIQNTLSAGFTTLTGGSKQKKVQNPVTRMPGGSWHQSARNARMDQGVLYAQLKGRNGKFGEETFVVVNPGDEFENRNGKFAKVGRTASKLFGGLF